MPHSSRHHYALHALAALHVSLTWTAMPSLCGAANATGCLGAGGVSFICTNPNLIFISIALSCFSPWRRGSISHDVRLLPGRSGQPGITDQSSASVWPIVTSQQ